MSYGRRTRTLEEEGFDGRKKNPKKEEEKMEKSNNEKINERMWSKETAAMKKLVEKLGNAEDKAECKKLKKELEEARCFLCEREQKSCLQSMAPLIQAAIRRMIKESVDAAIRLREKTMKVDAYIRGLTDNIKGEVISSKSANLNEANNQKQGNARAMITAPMMERCLLDHPPLCERCFTRHVGPLGEQGQLRNQMRQGRVKQEEVGEVRGRAYAIKDAEPQGPNVVTSTFLLNNRYASVLFDSGFDRSFVDTRFSSMLNIDPFKTGASYEGINEGFFDFKPLTKLTQKDKKYEWGKEEEEAFQTLKQKLCSAPILVLLRTEDLWILRCDT
ncbi:hypothetical protein Tco_0233457 [Tanacetum coccineum]